jgi:hypothetical protein
VNTQRPTERLDAPGVRNAPDTPGVYMLFQGDRVIFIGMSDKSLRFALGSHQQGDEGTLTGHATGYWCEAVERSLASGRMRQLVEEYKTLHNMNVPVGNRAPFWSRRVPVLTSATGEAAGPVSSLLPRRAVPAAS